MKKDYLLCGFYSVKRKKKLCSHVERFYLIQVNAGGLDTNCLKF